MKLLAAQHVITCGLPSFLRFEGSLRFERWLATEATQRLPCITNNTYITSFPSRRASSPTAFTPRSHFLFLSLDLGFLLAYNVCQRHFFLSQPLYVLLLPLQVTADLFEDIAKAGLREKVDEFICFILGCSKFV